MVKIAKKKKKSKKLNRSDMKGPDQFQEASSRGAEWLTENRVQVAASLLAVFILALGLYLYRSMNNSQAHAVTTALTKTLKLVEAKVEEDKDKDKDKDTDTDTDEKSFKTRKAKYEAISKKVDEQLKKHSGAKASAFLRIIQANNYFKQGLYKKSVTAHQSFLSTADVNSSTYFLSLSSLLRAAEAAKQDKVGIDALQSFLTKSSSNLRPFAAVQLAEYYQRKKDFANAKKLYKQLSESKSLLKLAGVKKLSDSLAKIQTKAKRRLALLP